MARQLLCFPVHKLWKPTLASRAAPKNGRTGPKLCSFPVLPLFWGPFSRMFSMMPCRGDRYYSHPSVATNIASETHGHSVSFLASASDGWSIRRGLETRYRALSLHNIHRLSQ
ncbi:hypothetical protein TNCV_1994831 [Trichonephila clavipes]|uniref:Uncharacterized protein n=1 Tax=Trichonephila clavipes TaxID=2585209 RepID=A0A8X6R1I6_TRICX|nr:hypothetical protein TNCV_1994831 [Trichonephila clavipes]